MNAICLVVAGIVRATLPADHFTLSWQHSVEKTRWEETYQVDGKALLLVRARVQGFGAGMEPPDDAVLQGGWWTWTPSRLAIEALPLTHSTYASDWTVCWNHRCRNLSALVPMAVDGTVVYLIACNALRR